MKLASLLLWVACAASLSAAARFAQEAPTLPGLLDSRTFELKVVGPNGEPVPQAHLEFRMTPKPASWIFHRGSLQDRPNRYGRFARADENGCASFEIPTTGIKYFSINVTTPGFGPFWAQWNPAENSAVIPDGYTIHLDAGVTIGGVVVDDAGQPVAGVEVHPSIEFKKRETDHSQLGVGTSLKTDDAGRWSFASIPATLDPVSVQLDHPQYMGTSLKLSLKDVTLSKGQQAAYQMRIPSGATVVGRVTSLDGMPIAGAKIRTEFGNAQRETVTDAEGRYRLTGCRPGRLTLVATAKTFGPEAQDIEATENGQPVDFQLPPGKTIRVRAVDNDGKPIPKFRVFFRNWRGTEYGYGLGMVLAYADDKGVWEWNEAPSDAIIADICPPEGLQLSSQTLIAREEDYVFKLSPSAPVIQGAVIDKITGLPIPAFRVVLGFDLGDGRIFWDRPDSFDGKNGKFYYRATYPRPAYQFRIEAPGYLPADSRQVLASEGNSDVLIHLLPGEDLKSTVLDPQGHPARGATVVVGVDGTQIQFRNGELSRHGNYCDQRTTGEEGAFAFPAQVGPYEIIVVHDSGSAWVTGTPGDKLPPIQLVPWASVSGRAMAGKEPLASASVSLNPHHGSHGGGRPNVSVSYDATTAADGTFRWSRVFPGEGIIARSVKHHVSERGYSTSWSHSQPAKFKSGETLDVQIGGMGRAIIGRLLPPTGPRHPVRWTSAVVNLQGSMASERYCTTVDSEGRFRLDDIPEGTFTLTAQLDHVAPTDIGSGSQMGSIERQVINPPLPNGKPLAEPLDLGDLQLKAP